MLTVRLCGVKITPSISTRTRRQVGRVNNGSKGESQPICRPSKTVPIIAVVPGAVHPLTRIQDRRNRLTCSRQNVQSRA